MKAKWVTIESLAKALNATVGKHGWLRSSPSDPVEEWRVNAAAILDAVDDKRCPREDARSGIGCDCQ